jgi:ketosteroid isomerase-like protein
MHIDKTQFANDWIAAWNSHDLDVIMALYSEDIEVTTPKIRSVAGISADSLKGKEVVRAYWQKALDRVPDLHFELVDVTEGVGCVALYYKSVMGKMAVEMMFLNEEGKVWRMYACYS